MLAGVREIPPQVKNVSTDAQAAAISPDVLAILNEMMIVTGLGRYMAALNVATPDTVYRAMYDEVRSRDEKNLLDDSQNWHIDRQ